MEKKIRKTEIKINKLSVVLFLFAFGLMFWRLYPQANMIGDSGDATSIWETITSFYSGNRVPSYVLYKGFLSVYPYVWFYNLSLMLGLSAFFFIKLYHCLLFAYVAAVGFPFMISKLFRAKLKIWRRVIFILLLFWIWRFNGALQVMMVDLPGLSIFILCINGALKIEDKGGKTAKLYFVYVGIMIGLCMCLSGQYFPSAICVIVFILFKTIPPRVFRDKSIRIGAVFAVICLFVGIVPAKAYNTYFEKTVVQPFRNTGVWLPTGREWTKAMPTLGMPVYKYANGPLIPNNRGIAMIKDFEGKNFDVAYKNQQAGGGAYNFKQLIKIYSAHPIDSITSWSNRLFLGLSTDDGRRSVSHLFIAYTALFLCLVIIKKRCRKVKEFFSPILFLILAFIIAALMPCAAHIEMRYMIALQGLIFATAVFDDTLWDGLKSFWRCIKQIVKTKSFIHCIDNPFPYTFAMYFIFLTMCFIHFAAIYEVVGTNPYEILFAR